MNMALKSTEFHIDALEFKLADNIPGYRFCGFCYRLMHATYAEKCKKKPSDECLGKWYHEGCLMKHQIRNHSVKF